MEVVPHSASDVEGVLGRLRSAPFRQAPMSGMSGQDCRRAADIEHAAAIESSAAEPDLVLRAGVNVRRVVTGHRATAVTVRACRTGRSRPVREAGSVGVPVRQLRKRACELLARIAGDGDEPDEVTGPDAQSQPRGIEPEMTLQRAVADVVDHGESAYR